MRFLLIRKSDNICVGDTHYAVAPVENSEIYYQQIDEFDTFDYMFREKVGDNWSEDIRFVIPEEPDGLTLLGVTSVQQELAITELKELIHSIGQGVVEIMLNQQMGGM